MKEWKKAESSFQKVLSIDPDSSEAHLGLSRCFLHWRMNKRAAEEALQSIGLLYFSPFAHFSLGIALHRLGHLPKAVEALKVAVSQSPGYAEAHKRLALIFEKRLNEPEKAAEHRRLADEARKQKKEFRKAKLDRKSVV